MSFFEKLQLNIPESEPPKTKKKRGRPPKIKEAAVKTTAPESSRTRTWKADENKEEGELALDVYETADEIVVISPVAGVNPEQLDISLENDMLVIKGSRPLPPQAEAQNAILQESWWGPFSRRLVLPVEVGSGKIKASMEEGILTIRIPKSEKRAKKKIVVESETQ